MGEAIGIFVLILGVAVFMSAKKKIDLVEMNRASTKKIYTDESGNIPSYLMESYEKSMGEYQEEYDSANKKQMLGIAGAVAGIAIVLISAVAMGSSSGTLKRCAVCHKTEKEVTLNRLKEDGEYYCPDHFMDAYEFYRDDSK